jgi:hypothetical protein
MATFSRNTQPMIANTVAGKPYLLVNAFHDVLGRGRLLSRIRRDD